MHKKPTADFLPSVFVFHVKHSVAVKVKF